MYKKYITRNPDFRILFLKYQWQPPQVEQEPEQLEGSHVAGSSPFMHISNIELTLLTTSSRAVLASLKRDMDSFSIILPYNS